MWITDGNAFAYNLNNVVRFSFSASNVKLYALDATSVRLREIGELGRDHLDEVKAFVANDVRFFKHNTNAIALDAFDQAIVTSDQGPHIAFLRSGLELFSAPLPSVEAGAEALKRLRSARVSAATTIATAR